MTMNGIVIPTKKPENLRACIDALQQTDHDLDTVVVVADGPEAFACADRDLGMIHVLSGEQPFCFARNVNAGIQHLIDGFGRRGTVAILNDDALVKTVRGMHQLQDLAVAFPQYGVVAAAVNGAVSCRDQKAKNVVDVSTHSTSQWTVPLNGPEVVRSQCKTVNFMAVAMQLDVWAGLGGLDERFGTLYGGDDDAFCYLARCAGWMLGIAPGVVVDHQTVESTFRPGNGSRNIDDTRARFIELYGFPMGER